MVAEIYVRNTREQKEKADFLLTLPSSLPPALPPSLPPSLPPPPLVAGYLYYKYVWAQRKYDGILEEEAEGRWSGKGGGEGGGREGGREGLGEGEGRQTGRVINIFIHQPLTLMPSLLSLPSSLPPSLPPRTSAGGESSRATGQCARYFGFFGAGAGGG